MNPTIEEEISEHPFDIADQAVVQGIALLWGTESRRGPAKLPELWTRVISLSHDNLTNIRSIPIDTDINIVKNIEINDKADEYEDHQRQ